MRIAVDAMGGDYAPREIVDGAVRAARELPHIDRLYLVGRESAIRAALPRGPQPASVEIVPAAEVIEMQESPAAAVRRKRDSSIARAVDLVKEGEADAVFSAGNTGAVVAATTLKLRPLECVERPAIAAVLPSIGEPFVLIDAGANPECSPRMLAQFAAMGVVYAREILGIATPRVGLLSIGGEESKGNVMTRETLGLLKRSPLHFQGNVEGHDLFAGAVHVVVCDGFVGNVVLKTSESAAHFLGQLLRQELTRSPGRKIGALLARPALEAVRQRGDPAAYGGAPLLGVNGVCIVGHGSSSARAAFNAVRAARDAVEHRINHLITETIGRVEAA